MTDMQRLWAPWRSRYLSRVQPRRCIFCAAKRGRDDRKTHVVVRGQQVFCLLNRYPYNNGHLMIAPYRHVGALQRLTAEEILELIRLAGRMEQALTALLRPHGFNLGINVGRAAGAGIPGHLHLHLVPRWVGDTNFMSVTSGSKVISQSLEVLYRRLAKPKGSVAS